MIGKVLSRFEARGDCYEVAGNLALNNPQLTLCHAIVAGHGKLKGYWISHAWVEVGDTVIDVSNSSKLVMPKDRYYEIAQVQKIRRYKGFDVSGLLCEHGHYGAWDKDVILTKGFVKKSESEDGGIEDER